MLIDKKAVHDFWEDASCGECLYLDGVNAIDYAEQSRIRYELEPYIRRFANFNQLGKRVLEIGVGLGADHQKFAEEGAVLTGVDLTERAIVHTGQRFKLLGLSSTSVDCGRGGSAFSGKLFRHGLLMGGAPSHA